MTDSDNLVVKGNIVTGHRIIDGGALVVREGRIAGLLENLDAAIAAEVIDFGECLILPGLVDSHVHTGSSPAEGVRRATAAAAAGGVTTIVDMPYDEPDPVVDRHRFEEKAQVVDREALVDVGLYGTMAKVDGVGALDGLVAAGAMAFKFSTYETHHRRFPRIADGDLLAAFRTLAGSRVPIVIHAEAQEIIDSLLGEAASRGENDPGVHGRTRPLVSETVAICKVAELALASGARLHVAHVTHPRGFEILERYRGLGADVSGETCVHYLALDESDVDRLGPIAKVNPPVRDEAALDGLWSCLREGRIRTISTDHAPWPREAKERPMLLAASGIPGLETFLPILFRESKVRGFDFPRLLEYATAHPADLFGLGGVKGRLEVGYDADFVVFDPHAEWEFEAARSQSSAKWSPFSGQRFPGRVKATYVRGSCVFKDDRITATPGHGQVLLRSRAARREVFSGAPAEA